MDEPCARHVVLVGLMGVGKTTVGRLIAARLGWALNDSDEVIEREHGATVRELRDREGVDAMHALEAQHLMRALQGAGQQVICAAASIADDHSCRVALGRADVLNVWLDGSPETLAHRFASGAHRPVYDPDAERMFTAQLEARGRRFRSLGGLRVSVERRTPDAVAREILCHPSLARREVPGG